MPTGSMANVLAVASLVSPGQEVLCEASAHIARAELGAHGAFTGLTMRTWRHPRGQIDLRRDRRDVRPRHGAVLRAHHRGLGREHPQLRRGSRAADRRPACAAHMGDVRRRRAPPRRRAAVERPRRHRRPARRVRRVRRRAVRVSLQGAGRADRLADGRDRPRRSRRHGSAGSGWAAGCARSGSWPRPVSTPSTTTSTGCATTTSTRSCSRRRAASIPGRCDTNIVVVPRDDAAAFVAGAPGGRCARLAGRATRRTPGHAPRRQPGAGRAGGERPRPALSLRRSVAPRVVRPTCH